MDFCEGTSPREESSKEWSTIVKTLHVCAFPSVKRAVKRKITTEFAWLTLFCPLMESILKIYWKGNERKHNDVSTIVNDCFDLKDVYVAKANFNWKLCIRKGKNTVYSYFWFSFDPTLRLEAHIINLFWDSNINVGLYSKVKVKHVAAVHSI